MPAPASATIENATKEAMLTAMLGDIDADASAGYIEILDESDTVLSTITLNQPAGTVATAQLTLSISGPDTSADASGTASWGAVYDGAGTLIFSLPVEQGAVAVSGKLVLNTTSIIAGGPVEVTSFVIG